jgi:hypothetical protein
MPRPVPCAARHDHRLAIESHRASSGRESTLARGRADQVFFATLATLERAAGVEVEKIG